MLNSIWHGLWDSFALLCHLASIWHSLSIFVLNAHLARFQPPLPKTIGTVVAPFADSTFGTIRNPCIMYMAQFHRPFKTPFTIFYLVLVPNTFSLIYQLCLNPNSNYKWNSKLTHQRNNSTCTYHPLKQIDTLLWIQKS